MSSLFKDIETLSQSIKDQHDYHVCFIDVDDRVDSSLINAIHRSFYRGDIDQDSAVNALDSIYSKYR